MLLVPCLFWSVLVLLIVVVVLLCAQRPAAAGACLTRSGPAAVRAAPARVTGVSFEFLNWLMG